MIFVLSQGVSNRPKTFTVCILLFNKWIWGKYRIAVISYFPKKIGEISIIDKGKSVVVSESDLGKLFRCLGLFHPISKILVYFS